MVGFVERSLEVNSCECKSQEVGGGGGGGMVIIFK